MRLTDEAWQLASAARELLAIVERTETRLEERRGVPAGRLTVAAFASAARGLLPPVLADLAARHPALDTRLTEVDPHLSVDLVAKGAVDLVVAHDWDIAPLPAPAGVEQAVIGDDLCDLLVPAGHRFAGGPRCGGRSWAASGGSASRRGGSATTGCCGPCGARGTNRTSSTRPRRTPRSSRWSRPGWVSP